MPASARLIRGVLFVLVLLAGPPLARSADTRGEAFAEGLLLSLFFLSVFATLAWLASRFRGRRRGWLASALAPSTLIVTLALLLLSLVGQAGR